MFKLEMVLVSKNTNMRYRSLGKFCYGRTDGRTDEQGDSRSRMHLSMMLDPDTCMYDAYIYVPRSLILIHACMMHKAMILALDPEACMYA